jgi:hypothetical protein
MVLMASTTVLTFPLSLAFFGHEFLPENLNRIISNALYIAGQLTSTALALH